MIVIVVVVVVAVVIVEKRKNIIHAQGRQFALSSEGMSTGSYGCGKLVNFFILASLLRFFKSSAHNLY